MPRRRVPGYTTRGNPHQGRSLMNGDNCMTSIWTWKEFGRLKPPLTASLCKTTDRLEVAASMSNELVYCHSTPPSAQRPPLTRHGFACVSDRPTLSLHPAMTCGRCNHQLGTHSEDVFADAQAPWMRRHNRMCDSWIQLCRSAGWHAQAEQLVSSPLTPANERTWSPLSLKAAELHGIHLDKMAAAKARRYHTVSWGRCHQDALIVVFFHDAQHHWMQTDILRLLHRLAPALARRTAPEAPSAWGTHFTQVTLQAAPPHACCVFGLLAAVFSERWPLVGCVV